MKEIIHKSRNLSILEHIAKVDSHETLKVCGDGAKTKDIRGIISEIGKNMDRSNRIISEMGKMDR